MRRVIRASPVFALPLGVAAAAFTVAVGLPAGDPDMWWHLASGRWMVEHRDGLRVDVFSSTATGEPYALGQWLGEVVLYLAYAAGSWTGVATLRAVLVALAAFAATRLALRSAPARVAIPLAVLALLLSKPAWTDRPQLFTLALFPVLLELCLAARGGSRAALIATVPLIAVWANLHGGYALGIAVLWVFALEALLERRPLAGPLAASAMATVLVSFEPGALSLLRAIGHVAGSTVRIAEESPVDPLTPFGALFALFVGATLAALMLRGGSVLSALVLVPVLWLALSAQRHVPLFGFAAVPFLAAPITALVHQVGTTLRRASTGGWRLRNRVRARGPGPAPSWMYVDPHQIDADPHQFDAETHSPPIEEEEAGVPRRLAPPTTRLIGRQGDVGRHQIDAEPSVDAPRPSSRSFPLALAIAGALWLGALASIATASLGPDLRPYPIRAVDALEASGGVLLNEYDWGGYLIWAAPSRPVFVDGRLFPFAGNGVIGAYQEAVLVLPSWRAVIERWNVAQVLVRPDRALVEALRDEGWTTRAEGEGFVLLERPR